ncbi:AAA family ATPase [Histomonas meleagridis]|uniref:AAA family ATPase n=1 Tax=Histomonas meleagridis TaxID=135588 RepID=UPI00355A7E8B|nr:AAA family ATPase [Histomonas meleagridis]KAH0801943.1 AAA family ATPase [Histomonas meleagridis]
MDLVKLSSLGLTDESPSKDEEPIEKEDVAEIESLDRLFKQLQPFDKDVKLESESPEFKKKSNKVLESFATITSNLEKQFEETQVEPQPMTAHQLRIERPFDNTIITFNPSASKKLQEVINELAEGHTLIIPSGAYSQPIELNKGIHLLADQSADIVVAGSEEAFKCQAVGAVIEGFTFHYKGTDSVPSVLISHGEVTFINCKFVGSESRAVIVKGCASTTFINCQFVDSKDCNIAVMGNSIVYCKNCTIKSSGQSGVYLQDESSSKFIGCKISNNKQHGVSIQDKASALFQKCTITKNKMHGLYVTSTSTEIMIRESTISDHENGFAVAMYQQGKCSLTSNTIKDNLKGSLLLCEFSNVLSLNNKFISNSKDFSAILMSQSAQCISEDDEIVGACKNGISLSNEAQFTGKGLSMKGILGNGIVHSKGTVVKLERSNFDYTKAAAISSKEGSRIEMTDCTFSNVSEDSAVVLNGAVNGFMKNCKVNKSKTGILAVAAIGDFVITNCDFSDNIIQSVNAKDGCTLRFESCNFTSTLGSKSKFNAVIHNDLEIEVKKPTNPIFINCNFTVSECAGVHITSGCSPIFKGCKFSQSANQGADIKGSSPIFENCEFTNNGMAAILIYQQSKVAITGCKITSNMMSGLVIKEVGTNATIKDTEISSHTASNGSAVQNGATATFENCNFFNNLKYHLISDRKAVANVIGCDFHSSGIGKGVIASNEGKMNISKKTKIHDESIVGAMTFDGELVIDDSDFYGCSQEAIYISGAKSKLTITGSRIHDNTPDGLFAADGEIIVKHNEFYNHSGHAIIIDKKVSHQLQNNVFTNNKVKDVLMT